MHWSQFGEGHFGCGLCEYTFQLAQNDKWPLIKNAHYSNVHSTGDSPIRPCKYIKYKFFNEQNLFVDQHYTWSIIKVSYC